MAKWKVKEGTQVKHDGKMLQAGDSFSATEEQIAARGLGAYVEPASEPKPEPKKPEPEAKAQTSSENKAQRAPEGSKAEHK